jgi:hypothetical protein
LSVDFQALRQLAKSIHFGTAAGGGGTGRDSTSHVKAPSCLEKTAHTERPASCDTKQNTTEQISKPAATGRRKTRSYEQMPARRVPSLAYYILWFSAVATTTCCGEARI